MMINGLASKAQINYFSIILSVLIILLCFSFWGGYFFQRKNTFEKKKLEKEIIALNHQIDSLTDQENNRRTNLNFIQLSQIYEAITESANKNRITIKNFDSAIDSYVIANGSINKVNPKLVKDSNNLKITIVGNYPDLINFFENLSENQFYLFKKIEIKSNQDPKYSIEVLLELINPAVKGAK